VIRCKVLVYEKSGGWHDSLLIYITVVGRCIWSLMSTLNAVVACRFFYLYQTVSRCVVLTSRWRGLKS